MDKLLEYVFLLEKPCCQKLLAESIIPDIKIEQL